MRFAKSLPLFLILSALATPLVAKGQDPTKDTQEKGEIDAQQRKTTTTDSIAELPEITIEGENLKMEDGKIVMYPSKSEKNLSGSISELIDNMSPGCLRVRNGNIETAGGQSVNLFINGRPLDDLDQATFWARNAMRVEFIPIPQEGRFEGKANVVNLIMKEYVVGGLTNLEGYQTLPNSGTYSAASKLVCKRMTFNLMAEGGYERNHSSGQQLDEVYRDIWYDGVHYDEVRNFQRTDNAERRNQFRTAFNARYLNPNKYRLTHTISLNRTSTPGNGSHGSGKYEPALFASANSMTSSSLRALSPSLKAEYGFVLPRRWWLTVNWNLAYGRSRNSYSYAEALATPIANLARENSWQAGVSMNLGSAIGQHFYWSLTALQAHGWFDTDYSGTTRARQKQRSNLDDVKLQLVWYPNPKLTLQLVPSLAIANKNINSKSETYVDPGMEGSVSYIIDSRNSLNAMAHLEHHEPAPSMWSDLILRQTELKWIEGNPRLDLSKWLTTAVSYYSTPARWLNLDLSAMFSRQTSVTDLCYRSGGRDYDGVIGSYANAYSIDEWRTNLSLTLRPFPFNLRILPRIGYVVNRAGSLNTIHDFRYSLSCRLYCGDFAFYLNYRGPIRDLNMGGREVQRTDPSYSLRVAYGNGNLNLAMNLNNPFSKHEVTRKWMTGDAYCYEGKSWTIGRSIDFSVEYTFDYGKKVEPGISVDSGENAPSSILGITTQGK